MSLGTILDKRDPVAKTQTDPISLKDKLEEVKDGEKGAPSPTFEYYPRKRIKKQFSTEFPASEEVHPQKQKNDRRIPEANDPIPENLSEEGQEDFDLELEEESSEFESEEEAKFESSEPEIASRETNDFSLSDAEEGEESQEEAFDDELFEESEATEDETTEQG